VQASRHSKAKFSPSCEDCKRDERFLSRICKVGVLACLIAI